MMMAYESSLPCRYHCVPVAQEGGQEEQGAGLVGVGKLFDGICNSQGKVEGFAMDGDTICLGSRAP